MTNPIRAASAPPPPAPETPEAWRAFFADASREALAKSRVQFQGSALWITKAPLTRRQWKALARSAGVPGSKLAQPGAGGVWVAYLDPHPDDPEPHRVAFVLHSGSPWARPWSITCGTGTRPVGHGALFEAAPLSPPSPSPFTPKDAP